MRVNVLLNETAGRNARAAVFQSGDKLELVLEHTVDEIRASRVLERVLADLTSGNIAAKLGRPFGAGDVVELVDSGDESLNVQYALGRDGKWQMTKTLGELLAAHYARQETEAAATMTLEQRVNRFVEVNESDGSAVRVIHEPSGGVLCEVLKDGMFVRAAKRFHADATSEWV